MQPKDVAYWSAYLTRLAKNYLGELYDELGICVVGWQQSRWQMTIGVELDPAHGHGEKFALTLFNRCALDLGDELTEWLPHIAEKLELRRVAR